jgi:hypothetical protein
MNNTTNKVLLAIGAVLVVVGFVKPDLNNIIPNPSPTPSPVVPSFEISEPENPSLKEAALEIAEILKNGGENHKNDALALSNLYADIAKLVSLDNENEVVRTTNELREVNSVAGSLMNLGLKGKYPNFASKARELVVSVLGDDIAVLSADSRAKAVEAFEALAWGCYEGAK